MEVLGGLRTLRVCFTTRPTPPISPIIPAIPKKPLAPNPSPGGGGEKIAGQFKLQRQNIPVTRAYASGLYAS